MRAMKSASFFCVLVCICVLPMVFAQDQGANSESATETKKEKVLFTLEAPKRRPDCRVKLSFEYFQNGDDVNVAGLLTDDGCAAAKGEYTISVRFRTDDGETENKDFVERWSREGNTPIEFDKNYPMGPNTDLVRVRTKRSKCVCTETEAQTDKGPEE